MGVHSSGSAGQRERSNARRQYPMVESVGFRGCMVHTSFFFFFFLELDIYCPQSVRLQDIVQHSDYTR